MRNFHAGLPGVSLRQNQDVLDLSYFQLDRDLLWRRPALVQLQLAPNVTVIAVRRDDMAPLLAAAQAYRDAQPVAAARESLPLARQPWIGDVVVRGRCAVQSVQLCQGMNCFMMLVSLCFLHCAS
jgi:hypothetical protein